MTSLLVSEWLKVRTTRTALGLTVALLGLVALAAAAVIASIPDDQALTEDWADLLAGNAGLSTLFALMFGVLLMTGEYRHGTVTWTFLATPHRWRVVVAKVVVAAFAGLALAVLAVIVTTAISIPWLEARNVDVESGELLRNIGGLLVGAAFWGALGVGVGTLLKNQVFAIIVSLVWLLVVENLVIALRDDVGRYLPQAALDAMLGGADLDDPLPRLVGGAVALAYVAGFAAVGFLVTTRRDVT
jgi:ABC-2 type transport system permease protein